ncbi:MAG: sugar ABC transporter permease, partial [Deinococcota bacterium]
MATLTGAKRGGALKHPPRQRYRHNLIAYIFIAPTILLYVVFVLYPFGRTIYLSLTDWNGFSPEFSFIGLNNYSRLFQDRLFWSALSHNLIWIVLGSIGAIGTALFLALLIYGQPRGWHFFRTVFFLPQVLGPAIVGIIWSLIYAPRRGLLYRLGERLNLGWLQHGFLGDTRTALYAVLVASIWVSIGFFFVIFLAGLQNIDISLLDAAKVDGANGIQRF